MFKYKIKFWSLEVYTGRCNYEMQGLLLMVKASWGNHAINNVIQIIKIWFWKFLTIFYSLILCRSVWRLFKEIFVSEQLVQHCNFNCHLDSSVCKWNLEI